MILYHAITNYHVLCCALHKMINDTNKESILYISNFNKDKDMLEKNIKKTNIFDDVKIFDEYRNYNKFKNNQKINIITDEIFNYMKSKNDINFNNIEEYNICGDQYSLGMYLTLNNIKYNYFEEACGILSQSSIVKNNIKNMSEKKYRLIKNIPLFGESDAVIKRYGNLSKQIDGYYNEKDVDFNISEILKKLNQKQIEKIINIFQDNIDNENKNSNIDLLLTQHFINLGFMTYDEQKNLYTLLVDYFSKKNNLVIKPHPSDVHGLYRQWFPNSIVLNRSLPSELLPYCINTQIDTGITASSTAILGLENVSTPIYFNNDIEKLYLNINRYYIALKILLSILCQKDKKIYLLGCFEQFFTNLAKINDIQLPELVEIEKIEYPTDEDNRKIFIVDDLSKLSKIPRTTYKIFQENLKQDDIVIFINSNNKQYFYNEEQLDKLKNIVTVVIEKNKIKEDVNENLLEKEYMYVYSENKSIGEKVNNMSERILLKNTGIELEVNQKNDIEIKTLQGILLATEERLLETIENNKKLKKENEKIKNSNSWKVTKPLRNISKIIKKKKTS